MFNNIPEKHAVFFKKYKLHLVFFSKFKILLKIEKNSLYFIKLLI